jgi:YYY domain-containing protein
MEKNRLISLSGLVLCLLVGGYLRLTGYDWAYDRIPDTPRDAQGGYVHPDERSVYSKAAGLHWDKVDRVEGESFLHYQKRAYKIHFLDKDSGLNIDSFNYGSFPYYVVVLLSWLGNTISAGAVRWFLLECVFLIFLLRWVVILARGFGTPERKPYTRRAIKEAVVAAAVYALLFYLAGKLFLFQEGKPLTFQWGYGSMAFLGRPLSALAGALTILYTYRIGARVYGRRTGLFAAILLTFTVLHIQLSHFYTFDVILAFFTTASIYSLLVLVDAETWGRRWRAACVASIWAGLGLATKFGAILFFIPWFFAFWLAFFRQRPKVAFFSLKTFGFGLHLKVIVIVSFALFWVTAFFAQPFAFLDYPAGPKEPVLSFVHLDLSPRKGTSPSSFRMKVVDACDWLDGYTSKIGFHFGPHLHPESKRPFENRLTVGGAKHWRDVDEQRVMAVSGAGVPWTRQYENTTPFLYQWKNLILYGMGPPLGLLCLCGLFFGFGNPFWRPCWKEWVIWFWMLPNFATTMAFHTKFPRYLIPQAPFYCLWAAALAVWAYAFLRTQWVRRGRVGFRWHAAVGAASLAAVVWSAAYALQFAQIYRDDHVWTVCSKWFEKNVPEGKKLITEQWDDSVPWDGRVASRYQHRTTQPVHTDEVGNIREICKTMAWSDYYCFSSKRNYGAFLQTPEKSPNRIRFVKSLFGGNLGYRLVKTFARPVNVLGFPIRYELADESLSLYDHPTVHIFEKIEKLSAEEIQDRILNPPSWIDGLSKEQILTADEHRSILAPTTHLAVQWWFVMLVVMGWVFWPIAFTLFRPARDGGLFASKMIGLVLVTYLTWFGASVGWWSNVAWATTGVFALWALVSACCIRSCGCAMGEFLRRQWKLAVLSELLFALVFGYFMGIRASNPDINFGEKPMDASFVSAAYKNETFPAVDPWFAGKPVNYYYYGQLMVGLFGRWVGAPPEYAYNLGAATWPALVFILVFGIVINTIGCKLGALIAAFLATMAGSGKTFFQLGANLHVAGGPADPKEFRESYVPHGLPGYFADAWEQIKAAFWLTGDVFEKVWLAFRAAFDPAYLEQAKQEHLSSLMGFDSYFWKLSRLVKSSVACEFPAWSATFADLHAHLLVMPVGALTLSLSIAYLSRKSEAWRLAAQGEFAERSRELGGAGTTLAQVLMIGLLIGVVTATNTWDFPGLLGFFFIGSALLLISHSRDYFPATQWRTGRALLRMKMWGRCLNRLGRRRLAAYQEVIIPTAAVFALSRAFFYPFYQSFETPERVKGPAFMHTAASGWVTPYEFLQIFGVFAAIVLVGLFFLYWRWTTSTRGAAWKSVLWTAMAVGSSVAGTLWLRALASKSFDMAKDQAAAQKMRLSERLGSPEYWRYLDADIAYLVGGFVFVLLLLLIPFLIRRGACFRETLGGLVLALGLAIVAGVEVVYLNETWGPPTHRWNTIFKFHLQAWICLSIGCGWLFGNWWKKPVPPLSLSGRVIGRFCRYAIGYPILIAALCFAAIFPMIAPYIFSRGDGFEGRTRHLAGVQTADGLNFLRVSDPDVAAAIDWLRAEVPGTQVIAEGSEIDSSYRDDRARFSTHTGLPTLIGWVHHSRERGNIPEPRLEEARTVFTSINREKVREALQREKVRYVVVGPTERLLYSAAGTKGSEKFVEWPDLFRPVFESKIKPPGVAIYAVDADYRIQKELVPSAPKENTLFVKESGLPLLRGGEGSSPGQYREPRGLSISKSGQAYIADTRNHRVQSFDAHGTLLWTMGEEGDTPGNFKEPNDLEIDSDGRLYVLDTWNSRVQVFSPTGEISQIIAMAAFGPRGIAVGQAPIAEATGGRLALSSPPKLTDKLVFVANTGGKNIFVFDPKGRKIAEWGGAGAETERLAEPVDAQVTPMGLAVTDARNLRVVFFDGRGHFLKAWPIPTESTGGTTNEMHMFWDESKKRLLVSDPEHNQVFAFDQDGKVLSKTAVPGTPIGLAVGADGKLYATLRQTHRVAVVPIQDR